MSILCPLDMIFLHKKCVSMWLKVLIFRSNTPENTPLQGEGQKFESSNAHHKKGSDISYFLFYFEVLCSVSGTMYQGF